MRRIVLVAAAFFAVSIFGLSSSGEAQARPPLSCGAVGGRRIPDRGGFSVVRSSCEEKGGETVVHVVFSRPVEPSSVTVESMRMDGASVPRNADVSFSRNGMTVRVVIPCGGIGTVELGEIYPFWGGNPVFPVVMAYAK